MPMKSIKQLHSEKKLYDRAPRSFHQHHRNTVSAKATSKPITSCQICGSKNFSSVLFLGYIPPVNAMPAIGSMPKEERAFPLELLRCAGCTLVQIGLEVAPEILFPPTYPYVSGSTKVLRENFADLHRESCGMLKLKKEDLIVDIGSNDGTLLSNFKNDGHRVLGVEPTNAGKLAIAAGIPTEISFFNKEKAAELKKQYGESRLMTAANVFAHIGGIHSIVDGILNWLEPNGVFISESHYLFSLIQTLQYDTIYHEHLRYYSVESLEALFAAHGMEVFHVKKIPSHGGSIRVYSARKGQFPRNASVNEFLKQEDQAGLTDGSALKTFREKVIQSKLDLMALFRELKKSGARIFGISAPSRASTLINYTGLDDGLVDAIMEIATSPKTGKYIPGTKIPVLDEKKLFEDQPEYALLFSWHIAAELTEKLRQKGFRGKFIIPLPEPRIV